MFKAEKVKNIIKVDVAALISILKPNVKQVGQKMFSFSIQYSI